MKRVRLWLEVYEHAQFGEIELMWLGREPDRSHLIAIQLEFWTPAEEVEDCLEWVRSLQERECTRGGDAVTSVN